MNISSAPPNSSGSLPRTGNASRPTIPPLPKGEGRGEGEPAQSIDLLVQLESRNNSLHFRFPQP